MRRAVVVSILIGFLIGQANLAELTKLPALVTHFFVHQAENPELGFLEFVHAHYCHEHFHCSQHEQDQSLPYQSCDFHVNLLTTPQIIRLEIAQLRIEEEVTHVAHYTAPGLSLMAIDIWQPPKL